MLLNLRLKQIKRRWLISASPQYAMNIGQRILWCNSCLFNTSILAQLNDCIGGLLHLGPNIITFRAWLHLGPNVITFWTLLQLVQLLHLGLQHTFHINIKILEIWLSESILYRRLTVTIFCRIWKNPNLSLWVSVNESVYKFLFDRDEHLWMFLQTRLTWIHHRSSSSIQSYSRYPCGLDPQKRWMILGFPRVAI